MSSESVPKKKRGMALGLAALLFVTGVVAGVAVDRLVDRDRGRSGERGWERRRPEAMARKYRERLDLDEAQARDVEKAARYLGGDARGDRSDRAEDRRHPAAGRSRDPRAPAPGSGRALRRDGGRGAAAPRGPAQGARASRAARRPSLTLRAAVPASRATAARHHSPVLGIEAHGSRLGSAEPRCSSSTEIRSGERTKAMRPSRGGRLIV